MDLRLLPHDGDEAFHRPLKRLKTLYCGVENGSLHDRYTIAWICALHIEMAAARVMLDEIHDELPKRVNDNNAYTLGSIKKHNIVIACLPEAQYGTNNAANVLTNVTRTFPSVRCGLMVGIGGGAPAKVDVRLGDVVVGTRVMQYDLGKVMAGGEIQRTAIPKIPDYSLRTVVTHLRAKHELQPSRIPLILQDNMRDYAEYNRPTTPDRLFQASYRHDLSVFNCHDCDQSQLRKRDTRGSQDPMIHYGAMASGNQVMKDAATRDNVARELDIICFEMEAAGLMDVLPCLPIRGICDYSDSHKAKEWQRYAAATAAAYAREFLEVLAADNEATEEHDHADSFAEQAVSIDRRKQLLESLKFEQIDSRKTTIKTAHIKTCYWFLKNTDYLNWLDFKKQVDHHGFLWIRGKPGAGKSIIMKFIYMKVKRTDRRHQALTSSFFFNARGDSLEKSVSGMYRSLLLQLLEGFSDLQQVLDDPDSIPRNQTDCPSVNSLKDLLRNAVYLLEGRSFTCFVDALDECDEQQVKDMVEFFEELAEYCTENHVWLRICFSSRHYPYIDVRSGIRLTLEDQRGHAEDLENYVTNRLQIRDRALVEELKPIMLEKAAGVFLWVALVVDMLNKENCRGRLALRKRLAETPSGLSELFKDLLRRDKENMEELLLSILWILFAQRPLKPEEYYHALWSGLSLEGLADLEMPDVDTSDASDCFDRCVISSSKGLAEITKAEPPTVQFIHESVRDFLVKDNGLHELWPELGTDWKSLSHERLKLCCNAYVHHQKIEKSISERESDETLSILEYMSKQYPFLEYASQSILYHANAAADIICQQLFLNEFPMPYWTRIFNIFEKHKIRRYTQEADILYILADRGFPTLIRTRLKENPSIEIQGERYGYPLLAGMAKGNKDCVTALLGLSLSVCDGIDVTDGLKCDLNSVRKNQTPFSWVCEKGHLAIAKLLFQRGTDINKVDGKGVTCLMRASRNGRVEVAMWLIDKGAAIDSEDRDGWTPLSLAVQEMNGAVVQLLLEKGAAAESRVTLYGQTPLSLAAQRGHEVVVRPLLAKGQRWPDAATCRCYGRTCVNDAATDR
ncbi:Pfs, NACHT and ankyrin domain protein [Dactylonectria estremocensis]|uniref:Pfs, NACHT and ankyrin domain protein n=1 Tax=Dactylonectria estremocensis TaxID=1079267 RepID=A0A9P9D857_9HYPO|nr:Pfs, NACHT and ankyrin domain protein [Dactylonectria estremocensis]